MLQEGAGFKIKRIEVKPGAAISLQLHHRRSEHWVVVAGAATVTRGSEHYVVGAHDSTMIPVGEKHRLENAGTEPLVVIESSAAITSARTTSSASRTSTGG